MKRMLFYLLAILAALVGAFAVFLLVATVKDYRPDPQELLYSKMQPRHCTSNELSITIWNIGYCGIGKDADFFYDGGKMVRSSRPEVENNLKNVAQFLSKVGSDFIFLQEVDVSSKRSYRINELQRIGESLGGYRHFFAYNYKAWFVPIPVAEPIGHVEAGVATLSRCAPYHVARHAYPGSEPWPVNLFQLKRCFMVSRYTAPNGNDLLLINTHNSAFDHDGKRREAELKMLRSFVLKEYEKGSYVIVGGDWNQTPPGYSKKVGTKEYTPQRIAQDLMPEGWQWACDLQTESMRFANQPYVEGKTLTATVDFFLTSPNVKLLEVCTEDFGFAHSDHNPVTARFELLPGE